MRWSRATLVAVWLAVVALVLCGGAAEAQKKKRRRGDADGKHFYTGATPSGSTKWKADSKGSIYTVVDTGHLKFDRVPKYFCTVTADSRKALMPVNATLETLHSLSPLVNVTGKNVPVHATNTGFRVRLRYKPEMERDLTETTARVGGWRVRWVAVSEGHSVVEKARGEVENAKYESGIDEKPVGQSLAYVKMLEELVKEEPSFVQAILGVDFEKPLSQRPKPKAPKAKEDKAKKAEDGKPAEEGATDSAAEEVAEEAATDETGADEAAADAADAADSAEGETAKE